MTVNGTDGSMNTMRYCETKDGRRLYRSRQGWIFGVCRGLADYLNISVFWTRVVVLVGFIFTGFWPVGVLYLLGALIMKLEPRRVYLTPAGTVELHTPERLRGRFERLDARLQRLESVVTGRGWDWDARLRED
jgi:phage shock protein C